MRDALESKPELWFLGIFNVEVLRTAFDRVLATRYGIAAIDAVHDGQFGRMVALQGNHIVSVPLKDVIGKRKTVNLELYEIAKVFSG